MTSAFSPARPKRSGKATSSPRPPRSRRKSHNKPHCGPAPAGPGRASDQIVMGFSSIGSAFKAARSFCSSLPGLGLRGKAQDALQKLDVGKSLPSGESKFGRLRGRRLYAPLWHLSGRKAGNEDGLKRSHSWDHKEPRRTSHIAPIFEFNEQEQQHPRST